MSICIRREISDQRASAAETPTGRGVPSPSPSPSPGSTETLTETGEALDSFAGVLGTLINAFKGMSDKKSSEKEENRTELWNNFTGLLNGENP